MTFQPVIPFGGYAGWRFLERTMESQQEAFEQSAPVTLATDAFRERIGDISSASDLMADRQLLQVALGAFGLDEDIDNKYFIQRVLEDGSLADDALANRMSDKRYLALTQAFGFGDIGGAGHTIRSTFADDIIERYQTKQFEIAVGEQSNDMRLAMNFEAELADVVETASSIDARWFSVMGSTPLRQVAEYALGLPSGIGTLDIDQQLTFFKDRAAAVFGSEDPADLLEPENLEKVTRLFLVRSEAAAASSQSGAAIAITLLQNIA